MDRIIRLPPQLYGVFFDNELIGYGEGHDQSYRTSTSIWTMGQDRNRETPQTIWGRAVWRVWFRRLILVRNVDELPITLMNQHGNTCFTNGYMQPEAGIVVGQQYIYDRIIVPFMERTTGL